MDFISDVDTSNTQDDKSGDNDCHVYHVDGRIDLQSCYKRKVMSFVVCRRKNGFLQLKIWRNKTEFHNARIPKKNYEINATEKCSSIKRDGLPSKTATSYSKLFCRSREKMHVTNLN